MENKILEKNLEALENMLPGWKHYIENEEYKENELYEERPQIEFSVEQGYFGEKISIAKIGETNYYLSGKYNPQGMAQRWAEKMEDADYGTVVFLVGLSDGRVLREIGNSISKDAVVLVYEPSIDLFLHVMENYPLDDIFENRTIGLIIEGINGEELTVVLGQAITVENMSKLRPVIQGNYEKLFESQVKKAIGILNKRVENLRFEWNTWVEFTNETIINTIKNYKYLYHHYSFNTLYNTLPEEVPVIVVAAGPSLDKNIDLLEEAKGKACIIACDTALKPLLKRGIIPDFFVVVDPRKPLELFDNPKIAEIPMICGLNIPYKVMEQHTGKKIFYFDTPFSLELFSKVFGKNWTNPEHRMSAMPTGGSVATNAFSAGRLMGAKTIILIGQDLALSGEKEHAEGTFEKDRKFDLENKSLPRVEGINGEMLPTLQNLKKYLEWFEEQIKTYEDTIKVIDATEGGALIHGSEVLTLKEALDTYCNTDFDSKEYLKQMKPHFSEEEQKKALEFFSEIPKRMEEVRKQVMQGKNLYKKLEKTARKKTYSMEEVRKLLKKTKKINNTLEKSTLAALIMDGLKGVEYTLRVTAYQFQDDEQKDLIESAQTGRLFLESMEIAINEVMPELIKLSEFQGEY